MFPTAHPSLFHFIETMMEYSQMRVDRLVEIIQGKVRPEQIKEVDIPKIPDNYCKYDPPNEREIRS